MTRHEETLMNIEKNLLDVEKRMKHLRRAILKELEEIKNELGEMYVS